MRFPFAFEERVGPVVLHRWAGEAEIVRGSGGDWVIHALLLTGCTGADGRPIAEYLLPREHGLWNSIALSLLNERRTEIDVAWFGQAVERLFGP